MKNVISKPITVKKIGDKTRMSLRPERVILNPSNDFDNTFKSVVKEIIYHGDHTRIRVSLLDQENFILKVPNSSDTVNIRNNDTISLGWSANDCRALDM